MWSAPRPGKVDVKNLERDQAERLRDAQHLRAPERRQSDW
jgi:hypothetical protein